MKTNNKYGNISIGIPQKVNFQKYQQSSIFKTIDEIIEFYNFITTNDDTTTVMVAKGTINFNYDIVLSLSNTLDSIKQLLKLGRINDAFSLIRKYNDAIIKHIYVLIASETEENLFFNDDYLPYNNIVNKWINGNSRIIEKADSPSIEQKYLSEIKNRDTVLYGLLFNKKTQQQYGQKRNIGDDNLHYNYWNTFRLNNSQIMEYPISLALLNDACDTIKLLFLIHFSYMILLKPDVMLPNVYTASLEEEIELVEATNNFAVSIVCDMFNKYVVTFDNKLAEYLNRCTFLKIM